MRNIIEYSSKASAVRGLGRMGISKDDAPKFIAQNRAGKFCVHQADVDAALKIENLSQHDKDLIFDYGHHKCPSCEVGLDNGVSDYDGLTDIHGDKGAYKLQQKEWACTACGHQWGADIEEPKTRARGTTGRRYENRAKSDIENPSEIVWAIADGDRELVRKQVVEQAVAKGVTVNTANAAYQHWRKARGLVKSKA